jgi:hypothetical protein
MRSPIATDVPRFGDEKSLASTRVAVAIGRRSVSRDFNLHVAALR